MCRRFLLPLVSAVALTVQAVLGAYAAAAIPAWTTYRHDAARSGMDPDSTIPVTPSQAWQTPALDGEVYGQPLVYGSYIYVATENDSVYKLDSATGAVVWSEHLAAPESSSVAPCGDISPSIGVTSTPVIDPFADRIYVVGAVSASGAVHHELFAVDLRSGDPIAGFPIMVDPLYPTGGAAVNQLQRAGLALDGGRILIGYGGNDGDCSTYWGWLVSAPVDSTTGLKSFQVDASDTAGAIWAAGNAPAVDAAGNVFVATGNGNGNSTSDPKYGDSVVKLNASASPLDWWAPPDWQSLDSSDADLGSSMPNLLPGGFLLQSGKDGNGYLLNGAGLGHVSSAAAEASGFCSGGSFGGSVYDPANSTVYAACTGGAEGAVAWLGIAAVARGQGRLRGALERNRTTDDRRGARLGDELLERHPLRARSDLRHDEKPFSDTGERVRRQPLRQSERRRRAAVRRERGPGDCLHNRPAAGLGSDQHDTGLLSQPGSRGHGRVDDCGNRPGA